MLVVGQVSQEQVEEISWVAFLVQELLKVGDEQE